jgi:hypothetical protein
MALPAHAGYPGGFSGEPPGSVVLEKGHLLRMSLSGQLGWEVD